MSPDLSHRLPDRLPPAPLPIPDRETFYRTHPPAAFVARLEARRHAPWTALLSGGLAAAVAALLVVALVPREQPHRAPSPRLNVHTPLPYGAAGAVRDKGLDQPLPDDSLPDHHAMRVQVLREGRFEPLADGSQLHEEDLLRFFYDARGADFLYLFSVDETGLITTYYPESRTLSVPIVRGRNIPLPDGVLLDNYVGFERFFALFSNRPLTYLEVEMAVRTELLRLVARGSHVGDLTALPLDCHQETVLIEKR